MKMSSYTTKLPKSAWPKKLPILTKDDIHKGNIQNDKGDKLCLIGWMFRAFHGITREDSRYEFRKALVKEIRAEKGRTMSPVDYNDGRKQTKAQIARLWNRVVRKFGYNVPCKR